MKINYGKSILEMIQMQLFYICLFFFIAFTGVNLTCMFWRAFTWGLFCFTYGMVLLSTVAYGLTTALITLLDKFEQPRMDNPST